MLGCRLDFEVRDRDLPAGIGMIQPVKIPAPETSPRAGLAPQLLET
jgi:hypothetical protein